MRFTSWVGNYQTDIRQRFQNGDNWQITIIFSYLVELTGATGHDLLDLSINAVLNPVFWADPICGAEVLFRVLLVPHRWWPGCGPCSEQERLPLALNRCSLLFLSWSNLAAISRCTSSLVVAEVIAFERVCMFFKLLLLINFNNVHLFRHCCFVWKTICRTKSRLSYSMNIKNIRIRIRRVKLKRDRPWGFVQFAG